MKKYKLFVIVFVLSNIVITQDFENLDFGTESTFEIMTWNIEWFPKNGLTTVDYVSQIIQSLEIDVLAIQEVSDTVLFTQMLDEITGYEGYFQSLWFAGLAYIYRMDVIQINDIYEILLKPMLVAIWTIFLYSFVTASSPARFEGAGKCVTA